MWYENIDWYEDISFSNRKLHDSIIVVGFKEIIDEISIQDWLHDSSYEGCPNHHVPI